MLVDGQVETLVLCNGDAAAQQRYTEARMSKDCSEMLRDYQNTVDFADNYDASERFESYSNVSNLSGWCYRDCRWDEPIFSTANLGKPLMVEADDG